MSRGLLNQRSQAGMGCFARLAARGHVICAIFTLAFGQTAFGEDRAVIQQPGKSRFPITGSVEDYNGQYLIMQIRSGEVARRYLREDVIEIQTAYTQHHEKGRRLLAEGRVAEAKTELTTALAEEDRKWVRREILAQMTRCALWNGNYRAAVTSFVPIVESDPETLHFGVAPLAWTIGASTSDVKQDARAWMDEKPPIMKLIGASYMLFDTERNDQAEVLLRRLAREANSSSLARLAQMQLWRVRSANGTATPQEMSRWEASVEEFPEEIRGGGYFVLGQTYRRQQEPERAAANLLWLPLVYDADRHLAAQACFDAAEQMESIGDTAQAANVYSEIVFRFGDTPVGGKAETKWEALRKGDKKE